MCVANGRCCPHRAIRCVPGCPGTGCSISNKCFWVFCNALGVIKVTNWRGGAVQHANVRLQNATANVLDSSRTRSRPRGCVSQAAVAIPKRHLGYTVLPRDRLHNSRTRFRIFGNVPELCMAVAKRCQMPAGGFRTRSQVLWMAPELDLVAARRGTLHHRVATVVRGMQRAIAAGCGGCIPMHSGKILERVQSCPTQPRLFRDTRRTPLRWL